VNIILFLKKIVDQNTTYTIYAMIWDEVDYGEATATLKEAKPTF